MDENAVDLVELIEKVAREACQGVSEPPDYQSLQDLEEVNTFGELVDRLTIVNIKLFKIKDIQANPLTSKEKLAESAKKDVALCAERNRLKNALTAKLESVAFRGYQNERIEQLKEQKLYGK